MSTWVLVALVWSCSPGSDPVSEIASPESGDASFPEDELANQDLADLLPPPGDSADTGSHGGAHEMCTSGQLASGQDARYEIHAALPDSVVIVVRGNPGGQTCIPGYPCFDMGNIQRFWTGTADENGYAIVDRWVPVGAAGKQLAVQSVSMAGGSSTISSVVVRELDGPDVTTDVCDADCDGVIGGDAVEDACGICGGDDSSCADDCGVPNGGNEDQDACGVCFGAHLAGHCDGACDLSDPSDAPDCDGVCSTGDSDGSVDCDGVCGSLDSSDSPDCDDDVAAGTLLADNVAEFSGVQGQDDWFYGYFDKGNDGDGHYDHASEFRLLPDFFPFGSFTTNSAERWSISSTPTRLTLIEALRQHPGGHAGTGYFPAEEWVIRRWVSEVTSPIHISGSYAGVNTGSKTFEVRHNGVIVHSDFFTGALTRPLDVHLTVHAGDAIDFIVFATSASINGGTGTHLQAQIHSTAP